MLFKMKKVTVETWFFHHHWQMSMTTGKHWNWPTSTWPHYSLTYPHRTNTMCDTVGWASGRESGL